MIRSILTLPAHPPGKWLEVIVPRLEPAEANVTVVVEGTVRLPAPSANIPDPAGILLD